MFGFVFFFFFDLKNIRSSSRRVFNFPNITCVDVLRIFRGRTYGVPDEGRQAAGEDACRDLALGYEEISNTGRVDLG